MLVLGIDPGIAITGWGLIDFTSRSQLNVVDFGVITTENGLELSERIQELYNDLSQIVKQYTPEAVGVETLLFSKNVKTAISVGEGRGVVLLVMAQAGIPIYEFNPNQVKNSVTGYGKADKFQVQKNVQAICKLDDLPKPDDAADALAVAITCYDSIKLNLKDKLRTVA